MDVKLKELHEALKAGHKAMCDAHGTVKFYLDREMNAPANHEEFAKEAGEKLSAYESAIFAMQTVLAPLEAEALGAQPPEGCGHQLTDSEFEYYENHRELPPSRRRSRERLGC